MRDRLLRVPEAARVLGLDGEVVYSLIDGGELDARKGPDGLVYVPEQAIEGYRQRKATTPRS